MDDAGKKQLAQAMAEFKKNDGLNAFLTLMIAKRTVEQHFGIKLSLDQLGEMLLAANDVVTSQDLQGP